MKRSCFLLAILAFSSLLQGTTPIDVQADLFELDGNRKLVIASGNVRVIQGDVVLKSNRAIYNQPQEIVILTDGVSVQKESLFLSCDEATAYGKSGRIESKKNIKFSYKEFKGEAGEAVYSVKEGKIALSDSPRVFRGDSWISGSSMTVNLATGKISTLGNAKLQYSPEQGK